MTLSRAIPLVLLALSVGAAAAGEPLASIPNPRVQNGTWVTDMAGALRAETVSRLNEAIADFERTTGGEMAVVVVRSLDGASIEESAAKLLEMWGIGKKDRDNGLLFLWSTGDRRMRVEVGYGLEGVLPDGKVGAILDTYVVPRFKAGEFDAGVLAGVEALLTAARNENVPLPAAATESYDGDDGLSFLGWLGTIPAWLGSFVGWRKWRRYHRRRCPQCRTVMARLGESQDNAHLNEGQAAEERVGSVDYDVWNCPSCGHHFTLRYPKWMTGYDKCPQCHHRTKSSKETVVRAATTQSTGSKRVEQKCAFCSFASTFLMDIPRITESSGSSSGGSSGSSFGGGSSGGGGASRGY